MTVYLLEVIKLAKRKLYQQLKNGGKMKLTNEQIEAIKNGELNLEQINEEIQKETAKAFNSGMSKAQEEAEKLKLEAEQTKKEREELEQQLKNKDVNHLELAQKMEQIIREQEETKKMSKKLSFENKMIANGIPEERRKVLLNTVSVDMVDDFDLEPFKQVGGTSQKIPEPQEEEKAEEETFYSKFIKKK